MPSNRITPEFSKWASDGESCVIDFLSHIKLHVLGLILTWDVFGVVLGSILTVTVWLSCCSVYEV